MYGPIIITGASGAIGSALAERCLQDGVCVHLVTRSATVPPRLAMFAGRATIHTIDWSDASSLATVVNAAQPRTLFHLAGARFAPPGPSLEEHLESAVTCAKQVVMALTFSPSTAVVFASSGAVYGDRMGAAEDDVLEPATWLGATKAMAELLLRCDGHIVRRPVVALRLFTPYGPGEDASRLIPSVIDAALAGDPLALTAGLQMRDYVYIDDVVDAFVFAARARPAQPAVYNIGSGVARRIRDVALEIFSQMDAQKLACFGARPDRFGDIPRMSGDISRALNELGWSPRISFDDGIARTIAARTKRRTIGAHQREWTLST